MFLLFVCLHALFAIVVTYCILYVCTLVVRKNGHGQLLGVKQSINQLATSLPIAIQLITLCKPSNHASSNKTAGVKHVQQAQMWIHPVGR